MHDARTGIIFASIFALVMAGCSSSASRVQPVQIDASQAASDAMELYDKDADGALAGAELDAAPGIKKYVDLYDQDDDGGVTRDEITNRLESWNNQRLAILGATVVVYLDGQPLDGATVTFVPETYLGPNVKPAIGVTRQTGLTRVSHAEEHLPKTANGRPIYGVTSGTFKIEITHPSQKIPAKYNTETELGAEIAFDINTAGGPIQLALSSR
jgi:uncharacterized protein YceK